VWRDRSRSMPLPELSLFDLFKKKSPPAETAEATPEPTPSWTERLKAGLGLSRAKLAGALTGVFVRRKLDDAALEALEDALIAGDVGVDATAHLIEDLKARWRRAGDGADPRSELAGA